MRNLFFLFVLLVEGCKPSATETVTNVGLFDVKGFAQELIKTHTVLSSRVTKSSFANNLYEEMEISKTDSIFWAKQLSPFLSINLNSPSLKDAFEIEIAVTENTSNLLKTVYTALPSSKTNIKKLEIKYLNSLAEVRQVVVEIENDNSVYASRQEVLLWTNRHGNVLQIDSLFFKGYNKTILLDSMVYESKVAVMY